MGLESRSEFQYRIVLSEPVSGTCREPVSWLRSGAALFGVGRTDLFDALLEVDLRLPARFLSHLERHGADVESVSDLARRLDRDKGAVSKDLRRLAELDIVEYEGGGDGAPKRPVLKHDHVVIEPVVY